MRVGSLGPGGPNPLEDLATGEVRLPWGSIPSP